MNSEHAEGVPSALSTLVFLATLRFDLRCPRCKSSFAIECYKQTWTKNGDGWRMMCWCKSCGNEFDKADAVEMYPTIADLKK